MGENPDPRFTEEVLADVLIEIVNDAQKIDQSKAMFSFVRTELIDKAKEALDAAYNRTPNREEKR